MSTRGSFAGPTMNPSLSPMNVGLAAGLRMPGMPPTAAGYPRSLSVAPQYTQVRLFASFSSLLFGAILLSKSYPNVFLCTFKVCFEKKSSFYNAEGEALAACLVLLPHLKGTNSNGFSAQFMKKLFQIVF